MSDSNNLPKSAYELKLEARRERYEDLAAKAQGQANSRLDTAMGSIAGIVPGQPILVGHHSEKRHRRDLARHDANMRASIDASEKAGYYASKAESVGRGGISSDDTNAVFKLEEKLATLKSNQEKMKKLNAIWRKFKKDPEAKATVKALADLSDKEREFVVNFVPLFSCDKGPFPSYRMTNNNANIRSTEKRIAKLKRNAEQPAAEPVTAEGYQIVENTEENRIQFLFDEKPNEETRSCLKSNGFRWSPTNKAWQRQLNENGRYAAKLVRKTLEAWRTTV